MTSAASAQSIDPQNIYPDSSSSSATAKPPIFQLPYELVENICSFLPADSVAKLGSTCRKLHDAIHDDVHWRKRFMAMRLPHSGDSPLPFSTWRELYLAHYPYWFIPEHKIWYADGTELDGGFCGQLLIARYQPFTGNIEGYALVGEQGQVSIQPWPEKPGVEIHIFHPRVRLHLAQPVLRLRPTLKKEQTSEAESQPKPESSKQPTNTKGLSSLRVASNDLNNATSVTARVMLARAIEPRYQHPSMRLWPPDRLPAIDRVRRHSPSMFSRPQPDMADRLNDPHGASYDRPTKHADVCQSAFRFQRQLGGRMAALFEMLNQGTTMGGNVRAAMAMAAGVATYSTLPEDAYIPTAEKPYQGIWVGDYGGHGCEFLLIRQKVTREEISLSEDVGPKHETPHDPIADSDDDDFDPDLSEELSDDSLGNEEDQDNELDFHDAEEELGEHESHHAAAATTATSHQMQAETDLQNEIRASARDSRHRKRPRFHSFPEGEVGETGRLEAIKLTGDPNVPRGEYTFVAEEIGKRGELYVAQTDIFKDKRVVQCWGHIAAHGFTEDVFIKTDLILVSHDCLAQHWHQFGHVAFYRRVDVEKLFNPLSDNVELAL